MFDAIGKMVIHWMTQLGEATNMVRSVLYWLARSRFEFKQFIEQCVVIGVDSFSVTAMTSLFTGMVLALQGGNTIGNIFGEPIYVGTLVTFSLIRELGPVLTAVVIAGRAGAAVTAHIGTMAVTEQLDALHTLGTNPTQYLVIPRMSAFLLTMPILTLFSNLFGVFGGYLVAIYALGIPGEVYMSDVTAFMGVADFMHGFLKSFIFAFLVATVCCYKGVSTRRGAPAVGKSTTGAVLTCIVMILVLDYFLTAILTAFGI